MTVSRRPHMLGLILLGTVLFQGCVSGPQTLTVMTYNIRHGVGMDGQLDLLRTAAVIQSVDPDVVILNEVDQHTQRAGQVDQVALLAGETGLNGYFARSIDYDGGGYGNALLSRYPLVDLVVHDLSVADSVEGRSIFQAGVQVGEDTIVVWGTHLGLDEAERLEQVTRILALIPEEPTSTILAGDLNALPASPELTLLSQRLRDGLAAAESAETTFPADAPSRRIDYILLSSDWKIVHVPKLDEALISQTSDHRPQVITLKRP